MHIAWKLLNINSTPTPINFLVTLLFKGKQGPLEFQNPPCVFLLPRCPHTCASSGISPTHTVVSYSQARWLLWIWCRVAGVSPNVVQSITELSFWGTTKGTAWYSEHILMSLNFREKKSVQCWMEHCWEKVPENKREMERSPALTGHNSAAEIEWLYPKLRGTWK